jgi:ribokinase
MFDIITVGSATVDVFANTESGLIKFKTPNGEEDFIAYPSGSKILIKEIHFLIGGGGTNTAVCFSRLGLKTGYVGKLGKDDQGKMVLECLKKEKIAFLGASGNTTGYSIILDSIEEDRTILTFKGANDTLQKKEVPFPKLASKWFYVSSMMNDSFQTSLDVVKYAKSKGSKIAFNPSGYQAKQGLEYLREFLSHTDVLILNKEEAKLLVGPLTNDELVKKLHVYGPGIVVITDGKRGVYVYDGIYFYHSNPTAHLKVVETTGAGDAFASSFVAGLIMGKKIEHCIKMGMCNAESLIQGRGAKTNLMKKKDLDLKVMHDERRVFKHGI